MIHDARSKPGGFGLTAERWARDPHIIRIARARGFKIPLPNFVALEATPARALLNHGVWRAWCPDCLGQAEDLWLGRPFFCMGCGNAGIGGSWRPVAWPENLAEIEATFSAYPTAAQNWEPWGATDWVAEADAWVEHARVMMDPEHGLTENELGGADDPETYTVPVLAVTNAIIASSDANVDKGDLRYFRQYISADPAAAGKFIRSSGANGGAWVAAGSLTDNIATTGTLSATGAISSSAGLSGTTGTFAGAITGVTTFNASGAITGGNYNGGSVSTGSISVLGITTGGGGHAFGGVGGITGCTAIGTGSLTASGAVSAGSYGGGSSTLGTPSFKGITVGADGITAGANGISTTGPVSPASYTGGSSTLGSPAFKGITVGADGAAIGAGGVVVTGGNVSAVAGTFSGAVSAGSYGGGSSLAGSPSVKGLTVGADGAVIGAGGVVTTGPVSPASYAGGSSAAGTPSVLGLTIGNSGLSVGSNGIASVGTITIAGVEVYWPSNPPPLGSGAAVPSGLIAIFATAAAIASGWARYTTLDGLIAVGAGTSFTVTFTEATSYGSSWAHTHTTPSHFHSGSSLGVSGNTGAAQGGVAYDEDETGSGHNTRDDAHTHNEGTLDVTGNTATDGSGTSGSTSWVIPSRAVVYAQKT